MLAILILPLCELGLLGILSGIVGTMTVLRGRVFFAESITHGAFPGAVIGVVCASVFTRDHSILALCVFLGALGLCLPLSALMSALARIPGVLMAASACAALAVCAFGFGFSLLTELSSGGCIALASGLFFCGCVAWEALASRPKAS